MAAGHGGPRTPAHPAPVSGPGKLSRRTDGGVTHQALSAVPDQGYGDMKQQLDSQRVAPMAGQAPLPKSAPTGGGQVQDVSAPPYQGGDFAGPSQRPSEPITSGAAIGAGPGPDALTFSPVNPAAGTGAMTSLLQNLSATDTTGILGQLMQAAQARNA